MKFQNYVVDSKSQFDKAIKDGSAIVSTINVVLMGVAGSGKTSMKDLLLNKQPKIPEDRSSTLVRDRVVHVRPITKSLYQIQGNMPGWKEISSEETIELLARAIQSLPQMNLEAKIRTISRQPTESSIATTSTSTDHSRAFENADRPYIAPVDPQTEQSTIQSIPVVTPARKAIVEVTDCVLKAMDKQLQATALATTQHSQNLSTRTVRIIDSGGQLQFQDIAPLFARHASVGLFLSRLIDDLDTFPCDDFYLDGKLLGPSIPSHNSYKETLLSLLQSFMSSTTHEKQPKCIFLGTFLDKITEPKEELLFKKNEELRNILPPELKDHTIFNGKSNTSVIFPLNTCSRDPSTLEIAEQIRIEIE